MLKKIDINALICENTATIKDAIKIIDSGGMSIAFIVDANKKFLGVVTDGDVRRALMAGKRLETNITEIMNANAITTKNPKNFMLSKKLSNKISLLPGYSIKIPVLDKEGKIKDVLLYYMNKKMSLASAMVKPEHAKHILVVGGAGYLGSIIVRKLLAKNYTVRILDNLTYGDAGIKDIMKNPNLEIINADMRDIKTLTTALRNIDAVIHLAGIVGDPACSLDPKETLETNLFATKILAEMCKYYQINRFVFASTCSVYGASAGDDYLTEESDLNPVSLYAESKLMMEKMLSEMSDDTFAPVLLRMGTLYGASPRMRFDLVINLLTAKAVVDKEITVFGGDQWRPFIHVDDAAEFYIECIEQPLDTVKGEIFNIGSEKENYKIIDIAKTINKKIPDSKLVIMNKEEDKRNYKISFKKAYSVFKTRPKKSVESAIDEIKSLPETKEYKKDIYSNKEHVKQAKSK